MQAGVVIPHPPASSLPLTFVSVKDVFLLLTRSLQVKIEATAATEGEKMSLSRVKHQKTSLCGFGQSNPRPASYNIVLKTASRHKL